MKKWTENVAWAVMCLIPAEVAACGTLTDQPIYHILGILCLIIAVAKVPWANKHENVWMFGLGFTVLPWICIPLTDRVMCFYRASNSLGWKLLAFGVMLPALISAGQLFLGGICRSIWPEQEALERNGNTASAVKEVR